MTIHESVCDCDSNQNNRNDDTETCRLDDGAIVGGLPGACYYYHGAVKRHEQLTEARSMCAKKSADGLHFEIVLVRCVESIYERIWA